MHHPLLRLLPLFRPHLPLLLASTGGLIVATALNLVGPMLVARAIDVDIAAGDVGGLRRTAGLFVAVLLASLAGTWLSRVAIEIVAQRAMLDLKAQLFDHLVDHDLALHDRQTSGRLITRVQGDTEALRVLFTEVVLTLPADLCLLVGMIAVIVSAAPDLALPVLGVLPAWVVAFLIFRRVAPPLYLEARKVKSGLTGFLSEHLRAMPMLQAHDRAAWARERAHAQNAEVFRREVVVQLLGNSYFNSLFLIRTLGLVALLWWGSLGVAAGTLTVGALVMGLGFLRQLFNPLMRLSHNMTALERARSASVRVGELLDTPRTIADPPDPVPWPGLTEALRLHDVGFHYVDGAPVLEGVDLDVPAGSRVGIVGATGAGKSTVLNLLLRFRDPVVGRVTVDGVDLRELAVSDLRSRIGLVLQDVHLFPGTVLDNLGGDRDRAQRALRTLGLDVPLDRVLTDGSDLSRGERQLLTFARAIVDDPELLVLDEATSAVDPATEARVQAALQRIQAGRTTVIVAHRLATVRDCDRIYVLGAGRVQESGTHAELLAADGVYAALHQLQEAA